MTNSGFQFGVRIGIHQIFHILGFSLSVHHDWNQFPYVAYKNIG